MQTVKIAPFQIIGISVKTCNQNGQAAQDIPALWTRFMSEGITAKIPNKIEESLFCVYTNYEGDYMSPYDTILGCKVSSLDEIPENMIGQAFAGSEYVNFTAQGDLNKGIVIQKWMEIWNTDLDRKYTADFEIYGAKAQNPTNAAVEIFVAVQ